MAHRFSAPALVILLLCVPVLAGGDSDKTKAIGNPFGTTKVGDFAVYKRDYGNVIIIEGHETWKKTVTAKDEKSVKLKVEGNPAGYGINVEGNKVEWTIDLTKPYDMVLEAVRMVHLVRKEDKFEKIGEGTEKIKVAGKEYNAHWITGKLTSKQPGVGEVIPNIKVWFSKDAPQDGLLRIKTGPKKEETGFIKEKTIVVELSESGSTK